MPYLTKKTAAKFLFVSVTAVFLWYYYSRKKEMSRYMNWWKNNSDIYFLENFWINTNKLWRTETERNRVSFKKHELFKHGCLSDPDF